MKIRKKSKQEQGITLIALVITIIVLLILASVTISAVLGDNGLIQKAKKSIQIHQNAVITENNQMNNASNFINAIANNQGEINTTPSLPEETIAKEGTYSYIGKYADINGDGIIDGIIYVDLLDTEHLSGRWDYGADNAFSITTDVTSSNVKDYVISQTNQTDSRWNSTEQKDVIKLANNQTGTKDRFYVMGLNNITHLTNSTFYWYKNMNDYETSSPDSNTGRQNTSEIKSKWATESYGATDPGDMWWYLITTPKAGANTTDAENDTLQYRWFVPSRAEWSAFGTNLGINESNYEKYNLDQQYWSSSQLFANRAFTAVFSGRYMYFPGVGSGGICVRMSATF